MNTKTISYKYLIKLILTNIIFIALALIVPIISHITSLPFYLLEPMRLFSILIFLFFNKKNGYLYSLYIPIINFLATGHPPFFKAILISVEHTINLIIFNYFTESKRIGISLSLIFSIILSKIIYYLMKYLFIKFNLIDGILISSNITYQLLSIVFIVIVVWLFDKLTSNRN